MTVAKLSGNPVNLTWPRRTHVEVTPEILARAAEWNRQPLPDSDEVVELKRQIAELKRHNAELLRAIEALQLRAAA